MFFFVVFFYCLVREIHHIGSTKEQTPFRRNIADEPVPMALGRTHSLLVFSPLDEALFTDPVSRLVLTLVLVKDDRIILSTKDACLTPLDALLTFSKRPVLHITIRQLSVAGFRVLLEEHRVPHFPILRGTPLESDPGSASPGHYRVHCGADIIVLRPLHFYSFTCLTGWADSAFKFF